MSLSSPDTPAARILAIAADHLRRFGAKRLTVSGVADEAGMTHANVYRYFASKADLIDAVAWEWLRRIEAQLADIAGAPDPADDKLERMIFALSRALTDMQESEPLLFKIYIEAIQQSRPLARRHQSRLSLFIERVIDEGIAAGTFIPKDRDEALCLFQDATWRFLDPISLRHDLAIPREARVRRVSNILNLGLRALKAGYV